MEVEVAIPTPLAQTFTYHHDQPIEAGVRVKVPFATQGKTVAIVVSCGPDQPAESRKFKLKKINEVIDQTPVFSPVMLEMAKWLSSYYLHPLGEVFRTMLPAARTASVKRTFELASPPTEDSILAGSVNPLPFFGRKASISEATLKKKLMALGMDTKQCAKELKRWQQRGWIRAVVSRDVKSKQTIEAAPEQQSLAAQPTSVSKELNAFQRRAVDTITQSLSESGEKRPYLLFGITGSGKTEVFLSVLSDLLKKDPKSQALVMVPEISLTPQMTNIFQARFPGLVAVVHSAMDDRDRWRELERIRSGEARILIGPRSAVFGPFLRLDLIIVDEEHDSSYKQGSGLLYNARDVAVMRGKLEKACVILGSATPSMESWHNATSRKYELLELPERATKRSLPEVTTIASKPSNKAISILRSGDLSTINEDSPFSEELISALKENHEVGHQSIVLVNRRGYAYNLFNLTTAKTAECPQCSISLTVHGRRRTLRCHYCDYQTSVDKIIKQDAADTWAIVGYGSQRAEDCLKTAIPGARIARIDSDTVADPRVLPELLTKFREGHIDILVGTQILAKGHDFPNVTLIGILEADQLLGFPDFRGGERTFQLLVQASGRAGRGALPGRVLVQSMRSSHPIVQDALRQDFLSFARTELSFREAMGYPPFGKMILFEMSSVDKTKLNEWCAQLEDKLDLLFEKSPELVPLVKILGPSPAAIEVIRGRTRRIMIVLSASHAVTRKVGQWIWQEIKSPPGDIRTKIDVDPQATL
jgi:primosomal protein N' (replication factor Y)